MLRTMLSVDNGRPSAFPFLVCPKIGDRIGLWRKDAPAHATIVGLRREAGPDGAGLILVSAQSI